MAQMNGNAVVVDWGNVIMQRIIPHLWYDKEALEAAKWYVSLFEDSEITGTATIPDTPSGDAESVAFRLAGLRMMAISAGPFFKFNPSISLMVSCAAMEEVDRLYAALSQGGMDLMPLDEYPFSKRYAWVQDRYGLSWQLMYAENMVGSHMIRPSMLFAGEVCGKAEEAIDFYVGIMDDSLKGFVNYYAEGEAADERASINYAEAKIRGTDIVAMDHGFGGEFTFNEAFSLVVPCDTQQEIDRLWEALTFVPEAEQCGWLKDRFGVSWQITPAIMDDIMMNGTAEQISRVTKAFLKMKKFDLAGIERAFRGEM